MDDPFFHCFVIAREPQRPRRSLALDTLPPAHFPVDPGSSKYSNVRPDPTHTLAGGIQEELHFITCQIDRLARSDPAANPSSFGSIFRLGELMYTEFFLEALCQENFQKRLIRNISFIGQKFKLFEH